jgi:DNA modification methylase
MRPSVKWCCWFGEPNCYRNQHAILWEPAKASKAHDLQDRALKKYPSGSSMREGRCTETMLKRGGSTPFNLLPVNEDTTDNLIMCTGGKRAGSLHGASTPLPLCEMWVRYLTPTGGKVLDPFSGVATVGVAAIKHGFDYIGIEQMNDYYEEAKVVLENAATTFQKPIM